LGGELDRGRGAIGWARLGDRGDAAAARTSPAAAVWMAEREPSIARGYSRPAPVPGPREWPPGLQNEITPMISAGSQP
jgi:hypothetical protein